MKTRSYLKCHLLVWSVLGFGFNSSMASAASFSVQPVRVYLNNQQSMTSMTVKNRSAAASLIQSQVMLWTQVDGESVLVPSDDLVVSPPIFEVKSGGIQTVRLGFIGKKRQDREQTYRLMLTEVPRASSENNNSTGSGIKINLRLSLPVFITPRDAKAKLVFSAEDHCDKGLRLSISNVGAKHSMITKVILSNSQSDGIIHKIEQHRYLLAGADAWWFIDTSEKKIPTTLEVSSSDLSGKESKHTISYSPASCEGSASSE